MASITFVDHTTVVPASWLNEVDALVHDVFAAASDVATARTALGVYSQAELDAGQLDTRYYTEAEVDALVDDLSGVTDAATARTNLDVYSQSETDALVDDLSGVSDAATARTNLDVYSKAETVALHGRRNTVINGDGRVNQRGYTSGTATTSANEYTLDRWRVVTSGQSLTFTGTNKKTMTAPAGGVEQVIEGESLETGTYTISFTGTATCTVGGVTKTSGDTFSATEGTDLTIKFTSGTFTDVQVELGSVQTPFEQRSIGEELALCQRYYWRGQLPGAGFGYKYGPTGVSLLGAGDVCYPVQMRVAPTLSIVTTPTYTNCSHTDLQGGTVGGFTHRVSVAPAGIFRVTGGVYSADAEL